jgi:hypothetical protein
MFNPADLGSQPSAEGFLHPELVTTPIKIIQSFSLFRQRNKSAWGIAALLRLRNEVNHPAFAAGMRLVRLAEVQTAGRILQYLRFPPRGMRRTPVTSVFQELKLEL